MHLLCVYCDRDARYMFEGTSLCKEHLIKEKSKQALQDSEELIIINAPEVPE